MFIATLCTTGANNLLMNKYIKKIYIHTKEYHSVIKKKEVLSVWTTSMYLQDIIVSDIHQTEKNHVCHHLHVESNTVELIETESKVVDVMNWDKWNKSDMLFNGFSVWTD